MTDLPEFYFRVRENGAAVFRVSTNNRQQRIEMAEIAVVNVKNGNVRPHGDHVLSQAEEQVIADWLEERRAVLSARDLEDIHRTIDQLNLTAQWAQSRASEAELDAVTDRLLLAMHDLRTVLVRRKADRLGPRAEAGQSGE
jgi:hypothetical protein